jgi:hypothetical protein
VPTRIDLQRYKKTYPFLRREPVILYTSTSEPTLSATIEAATASFGGSDQITYNFTKTFASAPKVTLTPIGTLANFNVFIVSVTSTQLVLKASVANSDSVHIHAIEVTA